MRASLLMSVSAASFLAATAAGAQTAAPASTGQAAPIATPTDHGEQAASAQSGLGDIIVTAQRQAENSQRAAVPLSVIDGSTLTSAGITQVDRLNELAPALSIEPTSSGNLIFVRGVGNFSTTAASDGAVAFNYDGVYIGRPTSTTGVFYDLQRVEVLKGPQGILYGRNATGGAINVLPVQPKIGELSGFATVSYGNYNTINAEGAINLPLGEHGAVRVSANTANHDGYFRDGTFDQKEYAFRVQMKAELTPDLTVRVAGDYAHDGGLGNSVNYYGVYARNPAVPLSATAVPGSNYYTFIPSGLSDAEGILSPASQAYRQTVTLGAYGRKVDALQVAPFQHNDFVGVNAEIALKMSAGTLTVVPQWRYAKLNYLSTAGSFAYANTETDEQYGVEARFAGKRISLFDYQLGLYYYGENDQPRPSLTLINLGSYSQAKYKTDSYAAFGRITANITNKLRLVGGLRYTKDDKTFNYASTSIVVSCVAVNAFGAPNCPLAPSVPLFTDPSTLPFRVPAAGGAPIPVFTGPGGPNYVVIRSLTTFNNVKSNNRITYRGAAEFDLAPRSLLYASVESGYRSGGFSPAVGFESYDPEYITAYTVGLKNRFLNNRLQLNLEGFIWNYTNQQIAHNGLDLSGRSASYVQNVGQSKIKGVEVEGRLLATPTTLVSTDVQYLHTRQERFAYLAGPGQPPLTGCAVTYTAANASPYLVDCAGFDSYNSPHWTVNVAGQQTLKLGDYQLVLGVDSQYKSRRNIGFAYLPQQTIRANYTTNAQVQFGPANERWAVAGYIRNIEDNRVELYSTTNPTALFLAAGSTAPRTYGVRASAKF
ncbi:TonB-dependent receptor [Sphingomonas bacterium]|uniref:TonB-dependent receptor n=1 Tax=Sphingomonas bacterium TaxID=1895847 RepID=UPI00157777E5|nr:TonB-dependent receptor [Sphingomonas bacterium]